MDEVLVPKGVLNMSARIISLECLNLLRAIEKGDTEASNRSLDELQSIAQILREAANAT